MLNWLNSSPLREEADDLNLGAGGGEGGEGGTPPAEGGEPSKPTFLLEIDDRTKYDDPNKAKEGFINLKQDRDKHLSRSQLLEQENLRLKRALGAEPEKKQPDMDPEKLAGHMRWRDAIGIPHLGIVTQDALDGPEFEARIEKALTKAEQSRLAVRGDAHITQFVKANELDLDQVEVEALQDYVGAIIGHEKNTELQQRFLSGDFKVIDEIIEKRFGAELKAKREAKAAQEAAAAKAKQTLGRNAATLDAKAKLKTLPAAPPKGGAAPVKGAEPEKKLKTSQDRLQRMNEILDERAAATA